MSLIDSSNTSLLSTRHLVVPSNLSINHSSEGGLYVTRGFGTYLYSSTGTTYLDCINNVAHVGHSNTYVNQKMLEQQMKLNTNTRYLNPVHTAYCSRLLSTFPSSLSSGGKCFLVASGSEANDLAMRICREHARHQRVLSGIADAFSPNENKSEDYFVCLDYAYHGATDSVIDISPYKHTHGAYYRASNPNIIVVDIPKSFANKHEVQTVLEKLQVKVNAVLGSGRSIAGFFAESILSCAGQVWLSASFLQSIYTIIHAAGGLCIADEVQTGFGRTGQWWAFLSQAIVPDIVTLGKPIGNGYPMAAVIVNQQVSSTFSLNKREYFNSCAGTHTAVTVGMAVMDCIEQTQLLKHCATVGAYLLQKLQLLQQTHCSLIYDVRGEGLFLGIEIHTTATNVENKNNNKSSLITTTIGAVESGKQLTKVSLDRLPLLQLPICSRLNSTAVAAATDSLVSPSHCSVTSGDICSWLCACLFHCRPVGVLVGSDGPLHNVIKLKPPCTFNEQDADYFCLTLNYCLQQLYKLHPCCCTNDSIANSSGGNQSQPNQLSSKL